ncbi:MAG: hypothetical protein ABIP39_14585 [Polyangiaceae bacterium]
MRLALVLFVLVTGCAGQTYGATENGTVPSRPAGALYPNWEHFCETVNTNNLSEALNNAGAQGWELVNVDARGLVCFKRPIPMVMTVVPAPAAPPPVAPPRGM